MINIDDNFQKQLLLKNAEIRALRSQMDPHSLFNVLNTIAWKAQIINNEEIYQMVISLGELLKANTPSKETDFIELEQETEYVKFYIYLQQRRFEDRIGCVIRIPEELMKCMVPCFCIQPLVENAFLKEQFLQVMTDHSYRPPFEEKLRIYGICLDRYHVAAFQLIPYHDDISSLKKSSSMKRKTLTATGITT